MSDITEIKRRLAERVLSVAEHLLPNGRKDGMEWRAGSVAGELGKSLGVHLGGQKAGVWQDFASGEGGDLIDLWMKAKGASLPEALDEARLFLGLERPTFDRPVRKEYARPPKPQCKAPVGLVRSYLTEIRNLPEHVLTAYRIGEDGDYIVFPFLLPDGTLALAKKRKAKDGEKPVPTARDCEPVLFGWQAIPKDARHVVITEGEIDALSWYAYGHPAMSVPFGGGGGNKQQWIENDFERMDRFEVIYIGTDMDEQGDAAAEEIANRLGRHRCLRVRIPRKDANECLVDGVAPDEMQACLANAVHLDPEGLRRASAYTDAVVELFWPTPGTKIGYSVPYAKIGDNLLFRPAEVTIWTGASGSGKSQLLSDCSVDWVRQGSRICIASLEMQPSMTLKRMVKQTVGADRPTEQAVRAALHWLDAGILMFDRVGKAGVETILETFDFARAKYGCDQFIIDSLMRLGVAGDDYTGQERVMYQVVDWAIQRRVHVHFVAHSRKGEKGGGPPETEDIKGGMEIGANAFNILSVWRNRGLEENIRKAETEHQRDELRQKPGVILNVAKQRNGDWEGKCALWFDQDTYQYRSALDDARWSRTYLPDMTDAAE